MAARLSHASGTPTILTLQLHEMDVEEAARTTDHKTAGGAVLRYVVGTRVRRATCLFMLRTAAEHDTFWTFYRSVMAVNTRFTFTADIVNYPGDTWSALFVSFPQFTRIRMGTRIVGGMRVEIEDLPVAL